MVWKVDTRQAGREPLMEEEVNVFVLLPAGTNHLE
jgi:hypothetical protein